MRVADLQEQLQAILGNPEAMGQITAMAQALSGGAQPPEGQVQEAQAQPEYAPVENPPQAPSTGQVPDLAGLLGMLGGGTGANSALNINPKIIQLALRLYGEYTAGDDQKTALLAALKPFLREERRETLERAERAARLARVIRSAMTLLREEGDGHV